MSHSMKYFQDDYEHISDRVEYILENELMTEPVPTAPQHKSYTLLNSLFNSAFTISCDCNPEASQCSNEQNCLHGGNYFYEKTSSQTELLLNPNRRVNDLIYECSSRCSCSGNCNNRLVQFGPRLNLEIVQSTRLGPKQLGLVSQTPLAVGSFICEYAGEILTAEESQRRHEAAENGAMNYIVCLIERSTGQDGTVHKTFIDPAHRGNIGRYLNHSCDPNCEVISVRVDGPIPRLGKTKRNVLSSFNVYWFSRFIYKTSRSSQ